MVPVNGFSANSHRISKQRSLPSERVRYACTLTTALLLQRYWNSTSKNEATNVYMFILSVESSVQLDIGIIYVNMASDCALQEHCQGSSSQLYTYGGQKCRSNLLVESWKLQLCVSFCVVSMLRGCRCCYMTLKQLNILRRPIYKKLRIGRGKKGLLILCKSVGVRTPVL